MKILITGITGLLGSEIAALLEEKHEIIGIARENSFGSVETLKLDISDYETVYRAVTKLNPDLIIHAAAMSNVDACESDPDQAFRVNAIGTRNLALACQRFDAALMYISTDYVFSGEGTPEGGYTEFNAASPQGVYARSKLYGELYVQQLLSKFFIIRTAWLFGGKRGNFVSHAAASLRDGKEIKAASDMTSSPTYVKDLAAAVIRLIDQPVYGIYHLTNSGFGSRHEIVMAIAKMMGLPVARNKKLTREELNLNGPPPPGFLA
jgi:dTDP-4-dehydrorhamnose reductase